MTPRILQDAGGGDIPNDQAGTDFAKGATVTQSPYNNGGSVSGLGLSPAALQLEPLIGPTIQPGGDLTGSIVTGLGGNPLPTNVANGFLKRNNANGAWEEVAYGSAADTVCQGNDSRLSDSRAPSGTAGGDLAGTYPNPTVKSSVGLSGAPTAPTAAVDTNTTQIASTAFVIGQASASGDGTPAMNGVAARGTSTHWARADHVHPTDTSRAPVASPSFTGTVTTQKFAPTQLAPTQLTGPVNDYSPTNLNTAGSLLLTSNGAYAITGLDAANASPWLVLINASGSALTLSNQSVSSAAANRFACPGGVDFTFSPGHAVLLVYDATNSRWRVTGS